MASAKKVSAVDDTYRVVAWVDELSRSLVHFRIEKNWNGRFFESDDGRPGEGDFEIEGSIKWDGCCNYSTAADGASHICSADEMEVVARCFRTAYELAEELSPTGERRLT